MVLIFLIIIVMFLFLNLLFLLMFELYLIFVEFMMGDEGYWGLFRLFVYYFGCSKLISYLLFLFIYSTNLLLWLLPSLYHHSNLQITTHHFSLNSPPHPQ